MEQNLQVLPKKVWSLIRVVYMMLRNGVSKKKILLDLNMMMKRAKIAGKALQNLMFHHHHNWAAFVATGRHSPPENHHLSFTTATATPPGAYEFSCSNSPTTTTTTCAKVKPYHFSLFSSFHKKNYFHGDNNGNNNNNNKEMVEGFSDVVLKAMEMVRSQSGSPALFGRSPAVRQLRITDSPFPLSGVDEDEDIHVDEAAEEFISRFYKDLMMQNSKASFSSSC